MSKKQPFPSYCGYICLGFVDIEGLYTLFYFLSAVITNCLIGLIDSHCNFLSQFLLIRLLHLFTASFFSFFTRFFFSDPSSENPSVSRSCQLGQNRGKPNSKKPLSMSQLMQWKHFSGQHQTFADPFLERIKENVSFIFQNVTSPTSPT